MLYATRKNKQLRIPNEKKNEYIRAGWTIRDASGKILYAPSDPEKQMKELAAENAALKAKLAAYEAAAAGKKSGRGAKAKAEAAD